MGAESAAITRKMELSPDSLLFIFPLQACTPCSPKSVPVQKTGLPQATRYTHRQTNHLHQCQETAAMSGSDSAYKIWVPITVISTVVLFVAVLYWGGCHRRGGHGHPPLSRSGGTARRSRGFTSTPSRHLPSDLPWEEVLTWTGGPTRPDPVHLARRGRGPPRRPRGDRVPVGGRAEAGTAAGPYDHADVVEREPVFR